MKCFFLSPVMVFFVTKQRQGNLMTEEISYEGFCHGSLRSAGP